MASLQPALDEGRTASVKLSRLRPGRNRLRFEETGVEALEESIKKHGLLQPIVARKSERDGGFEVIAGHRRLEALRRIGAEDAACRIVEATDREAFEISLVENLQRDSINPAEEAMAFHQYIDINKWGTRRSLANRIGKSPEYISHRIQLLQLPQDVLSRVGSQISTSHAEELAWLDDQKAASRLVEYAVEKKLSVHELHELVKLEKRKHKRRSGPSLTEMDFDKRTESEKEGSQVDEVLQTSVVALRYLMDYLDNCVHSAKGENGLEFARFLTDERFKVHQILDDFVAAEVKVRRARNGGGRGLGLAHAPQVPSGF